MYVVKKSIFIDEQNLLNFFKGSYKKFEIAMNAAGAFGNKKY